MATGFKKFKRTLTANQEITINASGSAFRCTAGDAIFFVEPGEASKVEMQAGIGIAGPERFSNWRIKNSGTPQTIEFYIGDGQILDNRFVGNVALSGGIKAAANASASHGAVTAGVAAALIHAANALRSNIVVQNNSANILFIGIDNTVTVANGIKVGPGQSATLTHAVAVWGIADTAATNVRWFEEVV